MLEAIAHEGTQFTQQSSPMATDSEATLQGRCVQDMVT